MERACGSDNLKAVQKRSKSGLQQCLFLVFHKIVANNVKYEGMAVFDSSHMGRFDENRMAGDLPKFSSRATGQADCCQLMLVGPLHSLYYVGRIAAAADGYQDVTFEGKILKLLDKNPVITKVISQGGYPGRAVIEADNFKAGIPVKRGAFSQVHGKVAGRGGTAAISADENLPVFPPGILENGNYVVDIREIELINHSSCFINVTGDKSGGYFIHVAFCPQFSEI